jgi:hypothetical protein
VELRSGSAARASISMLSRRRQRLILTLTYGSGMASVLEGFLMLERDSA